MNIHPSSPFESEQARPSFHVFIESQPFKHKLCPYCYHSNEPNSNLGSHLLRGEAIFSKLTDAIFAEHEAIFEPFVRAIHKSHFRSFCENHLSESFVTVEQTLRYMVLFDVIELNDFICCGDMHAFVAVFVLDLWLGLTCMIVSLCTDGVLVLSAISEF
ncbi:uncharacterized protein G2W53_020548 [Senna tora]|uniref:Uncharacterized protein n=1 Tax=Senna tora TaxID=362788 RepID=A0A834WSE9_9FABA|nr:uncharacterized protein G2W53_020548 [Senna tora]